MQLVMVVVLMVFPGLVTFTLDKKVEVDLDTIEITVEGDAGGKAEGEGGWGAQSESFGGAADGTGSPGAAASGPDGGTTQRGW
jgi:hypothetical protein